MKKPNIFRRSVLAAAIVTILGVASGEALAATSADPNKLNVTVYKTEVSTDGTTWITVMNDTAGKTIDIVGNIGSAFGEGAVDAGRYERVRFTVKNQLSYGHPLITGTGDSCAASTTDKTLLIDSAQGATAQVGLTFGTNGGVGWRANGTDAYPYLMTQPIIVSGGATTDVRLAFKTAGTIDCTGGTVTVKAPTFDVYSVVLGSGSGAVFTQSDYWILSLGKNVTDGLWDNSATGTNAKIEPEMVTDSSGVSRPLYDVLLNSDPTSTDPATSVTLTVSGASRIFGPYTDPYNSGKPITVGEFFRAQIRRNSSNELRWGMKVRFTPDATNPNTGTVSFVRDAGKHRHFLDESNYSGTDVGVTIAPTTDGTVTVVGTYTLDASNRFTMTGSDGAIMKGAFDPSYEVLTVTDMNGKPTDASLNVGIKVQTTGTAPLAISLPAAGAKTVFSWLSYNWEFERYNALGAVSPWQAKNSYLSWDSSNIQIMTMAPNATTSANYDFTSNEFRSAGRIQNPVAAHVCDSMAAGTSCGPNPAWGKPEGGARYSEMFTNETAENVTTKLTPAGSDKNAGLLSNMIPGDTNPPWVAKSALTGVVAIASGTADTDPRWSSTTTERHGLGYAVGMEQAALGTHTNASVGGDFAASFMWDAINNGKKDVGSGYAEFKLDGVDNINVNFVEKSTDGGVTSGTLNAKYSVETLCFGLTANGKAASKGTAVTHAGVTYTTADELRTFLSMDAAKLAINDTTCTGGEKTQLLLGYDNADGKTVFSTGNPVIAFMINKDGNVLTFMDPKSFGSGDRRQLGVAVKLKAL